MVGTLKAIETRYKGYRFRSRLEARWAVYFDTLGYEWEYEKEGYDLGDAGWYLPDFWLKSVNMWAEVKGTDPSQQECRRIHELVMQTGFSCLLLVGTPDVQCYPVLTLCGDSEEHDAYCYAGYRRKWIFYLLNEQGVLVCTGGCEEMWPGQLKAVDAARGARFEHGESGTPS